MASEKIDFHVNSWLNDKALKNCSLEAHGLWINLICLMQKSSVKGKLLTNKGVLITQEDIPELISRGDEKELIEATLMELVENKVLKIDEYGAYYSKKLIEVNEAKKKTKSKVPFYQEAIDSYYKWYEEKFKIKPRVAIADFAALKDILTHLNAISTDKYNSHDLFVAILAGWDKLDPYMKAQTDLRQINFNLNKIIIHLKNGKSSKKTGYQSAAEKNKSELSDLEAETRRKLAGS